MLVLVFYKIMTHFILNKTFVLDIKIQLKKVIWVQCPISLSLTESYAYLRSPDSTVLLLSMQIKPMQIKITLDQRYQ